MFVDCEPKYFSETSDELDQFLTKACYITKITKADNSLVPHRIAAIVKVENNEMDDEKGPTLTTVLTGSAPIGNTGNTTSLNFIVDTGACLTTITRHDLRIMGLVSTGTTTIRTPTPSGSNANEHQNLVASYKMRLSDGTFSKVLKRVVVMDSRYLGTDYLQFFQLHVTSGIPSVVWANANMIAFTEYA